jgi:hypothetical protein
MVEVTVLARGTTVDVWYEVSMEPTKPAQLERRANARFAAMKPKPGWRLKFRHPKREGNEFDGDTKWKAWERQREGCASCGAQIVARKLKNGDPQFFVPEYGERAEAHHMTQAKYFGDGDLKNCVVVCESCHRNAHEGSNFRFGTVNGREPDYSNYSGQDLRKRVSP